MILQISTHFHILAKMGYQLAKIDFFTGIIVKNLRFQEKMILNLEKMETTKSCGSHFYKNTLQYPLLS